MTLRNLIKGRNENGILEGYVGFSESKEKVLAASGDYDFAGVWTHYGVRGFISHRAVHLFTVLASG